MQKAIRISLLDNYLKNIDFYFQLRHKECGTGCQESRMQFDRPKLKNAILYSCLKCGPSALGAVKLHKLLYYSDMLHYAEHGRPLIGATYRKRPFGPTCDQLPAALRDLSENHELKAEEVDYFGYKKKQFTVLRAPDLTRLDPSEREILDEVIEFVCFNNSAKTISEFSHNRAWELAEFGEELPYHTVFQIFPTEVSLEALEWAKTRADEIETERSKSDPMGYVSFADFRSRVLEARRPK
ncbi:MAG: SocA family protein [Methylobacteriaceae bacterium]|nr:SocA family protein [Methylobacteriaceae bacterium]